MRVLLLALLLFCGYVNHAAAQALSPGDTIQISVLQDPKLDRSVLIGPDGMIAFPLAGHIHAGGMTAQALEHVLRRRLAKDYNGQLDVTVSLASISPAQQAEMQPRFYVTGEVVKPGYYVDKPRVNVVQAIAMAGGLSPFAASTRIQIHRQTRGRNSVFLFNYDAYQAGHDAAANIKLRSGDVVIVPQRGLFE